MCGVACGFVQSFGYTECGRCGEKWQMANPNPIFYFISTGHGSTFGPPDISIFSFFLLLQSLHSNVGECLKSGGIFLNN